MGKGIVRRNRAVGPDVEDEPFVVGPSPNAGGFDGVIHLPNRGVLGPHRQEADRPAVPLLLLREGISGIGVDVELHREGGFGVGDRRDINLGVHDRDAFRTLDISAGDAAGPLNFQLKNRFIKLLNVIQANGKVLQVEHELRCIFLHSGDRSKLVKDFVNANCGDARSNDGGEEDAAEGVTDGLSVTALKRFEDELRVVGTLVEGRNLGQVSGSSGV